MTRGQAEIDAVASLPEEERSPSGGGVDQFIADWEAGPWRLFADMTRGAPSEEEPVDPAQAKALPWRKVRELIEALSFFNQLTGEAMTGHVTISFGVLGIDEPRKASALLSAYNNAITHWVVRRAADRGCWGKHTYLYVYERGPRLGLHVHQLFWTPPRLHLAMRDWTMNWFKERAGNAWRDNAVRVEVRPTSDERLRIKRQGALIRYLLKGMEDKELRLPDGRRVSARELLGVRHARGSLSPGVAQVCGTSRNIAWAAQRRPFQRQHPDWAAFQERELLQPMQVAFSDEYLTDWEFEWRRQRLEELERLRVIRSLNI